MVHVLSPGFKNEFMKHDDAPENVFIMNLSVGLGFSSS